MLRTEAVETLLFEDVARIRSAADSGERRIEEVVRAGRRARLMAIADWVAIALLYFWRDPVSAFLALGATEDAVFSLAVLAVAVHSGFRLGQSEKYRAVETAIRSVSRLRAGQ